MYTATQFEAIITALRTTGEILNATLESKAQRSARLNRERIAEGRTARANAIPMGSCPSFNKSSGVTWQGD